MNLALTVLQHYVITGLLTPPPQKKHDRVQYSILQTKEEVKILFR